MTTQRDIERILENWLRDGPDAVADRVIDGVADRIEHQSQRPSWQIHWRDSHVTTNLKPFAAIAAAIVLAVGFAAVYFVRPADSPGVSGGSARPSPSASRQPSSEPSPVVNCEDNLPGCAGPLSAGSHQSTKFKPSLTYDTVGAPGAWLNVIDLPAIYKIDQGNPGDPYALLWSDASIAVQDATCSATPDPARGRKTADWIAMLTSHPGLVASTPVSVAMGSDTAQQVELALKPSWTATCPQHQGPTVSFLTQPIAGRASEYGLGQGERVLVTVIDIGKRTIVIETYGPLDPASFATSTQPVRTLIASFRFACGVPDGPCGTP